jgi:hypothetical protein
MAALCISRGFEKWVAAHYDKSDVPGYEGIYSQAVMRVSHAGNLSVGSTAW